MGNRADDVLNKLAYARTKLLSLGEELNGAVTTDAQIPFVGEKVGEIISACRECFDYAARDLCELLIGEGSRRIYFPFSESGLNSGPWIKLIKSNNEAYTCLKDLVDKIRDGGSYENTLFSYGVIKKVNDLVNDKKHNRVTVTRIRKNSATHVAFPGGAQITMSPVYNFDGDSPDYSAEADAQTMIANHPDISISYISEYKIKDNNWEVYRFCDHAIEISWRVLEDVYKAAGIVSESKTFNPRESLKPPEQVEYEAFLLRVRHISTELLLVGFLFDDKETRLIRLEPSEIQSHDADDAYLSDLVRHAFLVHVLPYEVGPKIREMIRERWRMLEGEGCGKRYAEVEYRLNNNVMIELPSGSCFRFNKMIWGVGTSFNQSEPEPLISSLFLSEDEVARVRKIFPDFNRTNMFVVGSNPI